MYLDFTREQRNLVNMRLTVIPIVTGMLGRVLNGLESGLKEFEIAGRIDIIQTTALLKIGQNIEKSPSDLSRLAVTQSPVKDHQLTLV